MPQQLGTSSANTSCDIGLATTLLHLVCRSVTTSVRRGNRSRNCKFNGRCLKTTSVSLWNSGCNYWTAWTICVFHDIFQVSMKPTPQSIWTMQNCFPGLKVQWSVIPYCYWVPGPILVCSIAHFVQYWIKSVQFVGMQKCAVLKFEINFNFVLDMCWRSEVDEI
jgi:hypothetical protein